MSKQTVMCTAAELTLILYVLLTMLEQTAHISPSPELLLSPCRFPWLCRYELLRPGPLSEYDGKWCRMHICTEEQTLFPTQHERGSDGPTPSHVPGAVYTTLLSNPHLH